MSFSLNKQILEGRLGRNPEVFGSEGSRVGVLSVATSEHWRAKEGGNWETLTTWHRVVLRNNDIDYAVQNLATGDCVYVEGVTRHRKWTGDDNVTRAVTEVHAHLLRLHTKAQPRNEASEPEGGPTQRPAQRPTQRQQTQAQRSADAAGSDPELGSHYADDDPTMMKF